MTMTSAAATTTGAAAPAFRRRVRHQQRHQRSQTGRKSGLFPRKMPSLVVVLVAFVAAYLAGAIVVLRWSAPAPVGRQTDGGADAAAVAITSTPSDPAARVLRRKEKGTGGTTGRRTVPHRRVGPHPRVACLDDDDRCPYSHASHHRSHGSSRSEYKHKRRKVKVHPELQRPSRSELEDADPEPEVEQPGDQSKCVLTEPWQGTFHPTCNSFHEIDVPTAVDLDEDDDDDAEGGSGSDFGSEAGGETRGIVGMREGGEEDDDDGTRQVRRGGSTATTLEERWARAATAGFHTARMRLLGLGGWRGVWRLARSHGGLEEEKEEEEILALKMLKFDVNFDPRTYRRHVVDAVASDRMSGSGVVTEIYGYCGHSVLNEFATTNLMKAIKALNRLDRARGFDLNATTIISSVAHAKRQRGEKRNNGTAAAAALTKPLPQRMPDLRDWPTLRRRIRYGRDAAYALSEMRSIDWHGGDSYNVTIVHKDVKPDNFLLVPRGRRGPVGSEGGGSGSGSGSQNDGDNGGHLLKLNDFNDAELVMFNVSSGGPCHFRRLRHDASYQSPEEAWELPLSHAVDIHALGGVLYFVLVGRRPYWDIDEAHAYAWLSLRLEPTLPVGLANSTHPAVREVLRLVRRCRSMNPAERPSGSEVVKRLDDLLGGGYLPGSSLDVE